MRLYLRLMGMCTIAAFAAGCTSNDKPVEDTGATISGPSTRLSGVTGGCATTVGDRVWFDVNCNGIQDKEEVGGPQNVNVYLYTCQGSLIASTTTDANGNYLFSNVNVGSYKVCFELPGGFGWSPRGQGDSAGLNSDANSDGCTDCFTVECDKPTITKDAGLCEKKEESDGCRFTGGGNDVYNDDEYTFGGQAGANTALQPQPAGEWEHNQHDGPSGSFAFHGGTHSAPDGTEIDRIECYDDGFCNPARKAPTHQLDFWGVGMFHSAKNLSTVLAENVVVGESLHWFEVNVDDSGEPGRDKGESADCPPNGFGLHSDVADVDCDCTDFYRITIHATTDPNSPVIYMVQGYFDGGNFQIHPLTGYDR